MSPFEALERQIEQLRSRETVTLVEKRNLLLEVEEFINSPDYQALSPDERNRLQLARKDLLALIQQQEAEGESRCSTSPAAGALPGYRQVSAIRCSGSGCCGSCPRAQPGCRAADGNG